MKQYTTCLTIAGSDSSGGAGIQADLKTFASLGCYGLSVLTALTAQNTRKIQEIFSIPGSFVLRQIQTVLEDIPIHAIKIGMLYQQETIRNVSRVLQKWNSIPIILDPVMMSTNGKILLQENAIRTLVEELFPIVTMITPNTDEAAFLTGQPIKERTDMEKAGKKLLNMKAQSVLVKGGHLQGEFSEDCLLIRELKKQDQVVWFRNQRVSTRNTHGTGCTLSSAITAFTAKEKNFRSAVRKAKDYLTKTIEMGKEYQLGNGVGPVHHFYSFWQ